MTKKKKMRVRVAPLIGCLVILLLIFAAPYVSELTRNTSRDGADVTITIEQGASTARIAEILKENKLIKSESIFKVRAKLSGKASQMNYGTFILNTGMCIPDIIDNLVDNTYRKETVMMTVPEGYSIEQIASRASQIFGFTEDDFFAALNDDYGYAFLNEIPQTNAKYRLQGFLFTKTYEFYKDASAHDVIETMLKQFELEVGEIKGYNGLSFYEVMTLASLIEREALLDSERPTIARVMYNRIDKNMRLQIDASVVYAVTDGAYDINRVTYKDLEVDSPYNTYKVDGLPVGPICNPGIMSIKAAYEPDNNDYLYYHTDTKKNDGSHIFTRTYEEHVATMN